MGTEVLKVLPMQHRSTRDHEIAKRAQPAERVQPGTREGGHTVLERIERSEALPATTSATQAFTQVMGALVQRLPAEEAVTFVERRLPAELSALLTNDAEEALEDGVEGDVADYIDEVAGKLELAESQARELVDVVIGSLRLLMSAEEVDAIADHLSPQLAAMWLRACDVPGAPGHSGSP
jgi:uncharacterized protein (DUF2267 family)